MAFLDFLLFEVLKNVLSSFKKSDLAPIFLVINMNELILSNAVVPYHQMYSQLCYGSKYSGGRGAGMWNQQ